MNIGLASTRSGVSQRMIRHYERIGLVPPPARRDSGYRDYDERDVHRLRFIANARDLGFSVAEIATLLGLWEDRERASAEVKHLALEHIEALDEKIAKLQAMRATLNELAERCHGDERPDCPILSELANAAPSTDAELR
ncbi:Cu(I)-responsive transcriptional regulator [Novosphingobium mangrovi (ex Huang et al. 2023)]|uniref:Cu(I)-responsive transcriptional regulator n=1 Tax=Novosphingobium mangrovi (ex Huang et al. 2023) TaxID=2976432 RepID=A0ABT2HZZ9_9SPHN|nr:Cu(I)-responsive transcriptional regulator [Novosphingobium mangrovi (ex Huang et al. 2023)]MCT2398115.1 Cu(I)-responsive transcriptional regulator [Novosphingobium mangrovi (ex Huang et al. 2023)]